MALESIGNFDYRWTHTYILSGYNRGLGFKAQFEEFPERLSWFHILHTRTSVYNLAIDPAGPTPRTLTQFTLYNTSRPEMDQIVPSHLIWLHTDILHMPPSCYNQLLLMSTY